jgi:hypothetical protein
MFAEFFRMTRASQMQEGEVENLIMQGCLGLEAANLYTVT